MSSHDIDPLKRRLQSHFSDGLVTIVGSGLSCAEGMPGMGELGDHLRRNVSPRIPSSELADWSIIADSIDDIGLEAALLKHAATDAIETAIVELTSEIILERERRILSDVFAGKRELRFSRMAKFLLKTDKPNPVITTNYDRLVEIAAEEAELGVETMFVGDFAGRLDPKGSRLSFCESVRLGPNKTVQTQFRRRIAIYKPHGSLDWYHRYGKPVRYMGDLDVPRLIITPGLKKFRSGYESPFDINREKANFEIDSANRFLILGYGFNDDHLETHLAPRISTGVDTVILTHRLTPNAMRIVNENENVIALTHEAVGTTEGTTVWQGSRRTFHAHINLWDVGSFVDEVFG